MFTAPAMVVARTMAAAAIAGIDFAQTPGIALSE
jgi:hypothetical protein